MAVFLIVISSPLPPVRYSGKNYLLGHLWEVSGLVICHWRQRSFDQEFPSSIRDLQMCSGQEVMKEWQMCIPIQSYSYDKFVSNFWDTVHYMIKISTGATLIYTFLSHRCSAYNTIVHFSFSRSFWRCIHSSRGSSCGCGHQNPFEE